MRVSDYIAILKETGSSIFKIDGYYFHRYGSKCYQFPPWTRINIERKLINYLRWRNFVSVILTDFKKKNTAEFILDTDDYSIDKFSRRVRNRIRKSLYYCTFKKPEIIDLLTSGLELNRQTCNRQNRNEENLTDKNKWNKIVQSLYTHDDIIILGAYYDDKMIGYIVVVKLEDKYCMQYAFIDRIDSNLTSPMNGIIYTLVNKLVKEEGRVKLSYGLDSIQPLIELNRFKANMLFKKIPVTRVYIIHPLLLPYYRFIIFIQVRLLRRKRFNSPYLRRLFRTYYGHKLLSQELMTGKIT